MRAWLVKSEPEEYSWQDLVRDGRAAWVTHVGDSRCYRWRDGALAQRTEDHSAVSGTCWRSGDHT